MAKFALLYRQRTDHVPNDPDENSAWMGWFGKMGNSLVDIGDQVVQSSALGATGEGTRLAGYSVITADDFEAALAIASGCPALVAGGGVEIGGLMEVAGK
jgi:hypothetical protein